MSVSSEDNPLISAQDSWVSISASWLFFSQDSNFRGHIQDSMSITEYVHVYVWVRVVKVWMLVWLSLWFHRGVRASIYTSPLSHHLIVVIKATISVLDNEGILHGDRCGCEQLSSSRLYLLAFLSSLFLNLDSLRWLSSRLSFTLSIVRQRVNWIMKSAAVSLSVYSVI